MTPTHQSCRGSSVLPFNILYATAWRENLLKDKDGKPEQKIAISRMDMPSSFSSYLADPRFTESFLERIDSNIVEGAVTDDKRKKSNFDPLLWRVWS